MAKKSPSSTGDKGRLNAQTDDLVFKALASADRRNILDLLRAGGRTTSDICVHLPHLDRTTVMQHLGVLQAAGLTISKKRGRCRWNYLDVAPIQGIYQRWIHCYSAPSTALLSALKQELESA